MGGLNHSDTETLAARWLRHNSRITAKEALLELVLGLTEKEASELLDYLNLLHNPDDLSADEIEAVKPWRDAAAWGETMSLPELRGLLSG